MVKGGYVKPGRRPVLRVPFSPLEVILEVMALVGVLFSILFVALSWPDMPPTIPTHFGASGRADAWGGRETLFILPAIAMALVYIPMTILSRFPHLFNYPWSITEANAARQYHLARVLLAFMKAETVWLFAYIEWQTIQVALGKAEGLGAAFLPVFMGVVFGTLGIYVYKGYKER